MRAGDPSHRGHWGNRTSRKARVQSLTIGGRQRVWISSLLFATATLIRPEGGLFTLVAGLFFLSSVARGRASARDLCIWVLPWALLVGSHFLWRYGVSHFADHAALRGDDHWKLRAVRLGEHTLVFTTLVPEAEFRRNFQHLEILF